MKNNAFVIAVYVDNKSGVLTRVTSMFTRRGFNIDALTVGETESPEYSRITISLSGEGYAREQLINQLLPLNSIANHLKQLITEHTIQHRYTVDCPKAARNRYLHPSEEYHIGKYTYGYKEEGVRQ